MNIFRLKFFPDEQQMYYALSMIILCGVVNVKVYIFFRRYFTYTQQSRIFLLGMIFIAKYSYYRSLGFFFLRFSVVVNRECTHYNGVILLVLLPDDETKKTPIILLTRVWDVVWVNASWKTDVPFPIFKSYQKIDKHDITTGAVYLYINNRTADETGQSSACGVHSVTNVHVFSLLFFFAAVPRKLSV